MPPRDSTFDFLTHGYLFADRIRDRLRPSGDEALPIRVFGREGALVSGLKGVRLFYDDNAIKRHGAMPATISDALFGRGSAHGLDGEQHRHRKALLVSLAFDGGQVDRLMPLIERQWTRYRAQWTSDGVGNVYRTANRVYGIAAMQWAGIPVDDKSGEQWADRLAQIVDAFGPASPGYLLARFNRLRCDQWARDLIERQRSGELKAEDGTALAELARFRELDGELLDAHTAGVELQNLIRPTIAVARFAAFAGHALYHHPEWRTRLWDEVQERESVVDGPQAVAFAQEVRRFYPFVPVLPAKATQELDVDGVHLNADDTVFIDIRHTLTDPQAWEHGDRFDPERFLDPATADREDFVPHGGGDVHTGHRCPGEKIAVRVLAVVAAGVSDPAVAIDPEGLEFSLHRFPTKPPSGVRVLVNPAS